MESSTVPILRNCPMTRCSSLSFVLFCAVGFVAAVEAHAAVPKVEDAPITVPVFGPRFKEIHERIDALYRYRNGAYPLPDARINLFRPLTERAVVLETPRDTT